MTIELSDAVSFIALGVSAAALIVGEFRHKENIQLGMRAVNMSAYELVYSYVDFVSKYKTLYVCIPVVGTRELVSKTETFQERIHLLGPLPIVGLGDKVKELVNHAWKLQRELDRWAGEARKPGNEFEENINEQKASEICTWFFEQKPKVKELFKDV